jgi:hypothetical protein
MKRFTIVALVCITGALLSASVARSAGSKSSSVVSITLPGDLSYRFKNGAGVDRANTYCLTCHSSAYVSTQPPLDHDHWAAEVTKMRKAYHADIPDQDASTIVDYLTATYGKP